MSVQKVNGSVAPEEHDACVNWREFTPYAKKVDELVVNDAKGAERIANLYERQQNTDECFKEMSKDMRITSDSLLKLVSRKEFMEKILILGLKGTIGLIGIWQFLVHFSKVIMKLI